MIVIFDRQHYGKPDRPDFGAQFDMDGSGDIENDEREANITPYYYNAAKDMLELHGHSVYVLQQGWYSTRHKKANDIARANPGQKVAYVACHINAGKGNYSAMIYDKRSTGGQILAEDLQQGMVQQLGFAPVKRHLVRAATADNAWRRGLTTIKGIYAGPANISGVCFEPCFIDNPDHHELLTNDGGKMIGSAIAAGLIRWGSR